MLTTTMTSAMILFALFVCILPAAQALNNGLAQAPPMGWNSWNSFGCDIDQDLIVQTALKLKELGLDKLGYTYINLDDCWMAKRRTFRGKLIGDSTRFSDGMKWLGDFLHEQGLKFGVYSSAGTKTCASRPASIWHEKADAQSFAEWGVDYLKYDNCNNKHKKGIDRYATMRDALNATGRPILYNICQWGWEDSWQWAKNYGNSWRTTGDIEAAWWSIEANFWESQQHFEQSGPGHWLDPDMLEVGHKDLTVYEENKSHFALWVMVKAPLLLGNDLTGDIAPEILDILTNQRLIDIHQDPDTPQATCYYGCDRDDKWCAREDKRARCEGVDPAASRNQSQEDYSIFATTRGGKHGGDTVVALIINWHDTSTLKARELDIVQLLGIAPFPHQGVEITELWSDQRVKRASRLRSPILSDKDDVSFAFKDLKRVPVPALKPHDCVVYSFKTINVSP